MATMCDAVKHIISLEENSARIYANISKVSDGELQTNAIRLQHEEEQHALQLGQLKENVTVEIPDEVEDMIRLAADEQTEWLDHPPAFTDSKGFFMQALRWEDDAVRLYEKMQQYFSPSTPAVSFFKALADTERSHMYTILNLLHQNRHT